jgi:undecaprenyl pyrophosphate phosphatase UppP
MDDFNPAVFARQIALVAVGYMSGRGILPAEMSGPVVDVLASAIVWAIGALVIWLGQRREKASAKIAEVAALPQVDRIKVADAQMVASIPNPKVTV